MPVGLEKILHRIYAANWPGLMAASFIMSVPVVVHLPGPAAAFRARPHRGRGQALSGSCSDGRALTLREVT